MIRPSTALLTAVLLVSSSHAALAVQGPHRDAGGLSLFDGETLNGWQGDPRFWRVEGGSLVGESSASIPCDRTTYLVLAEQEFADFDLTLRYRLAAGNSGVQLRSRRTGEFEIEGYQADLESGPDWTGGFYEQGGRGVIARRGERVVLLPEPRPAERFASGERLQQLVRPGDWNTYRVQAFGPRLTIWLNGVLTCEVIDLDPTRAAARGVLALQLHQGPPMRVEFRDLVLRQLVDESHATPPAPALDPGEPGAGRGRWVWAPAEAADQELWLHRSFQLDERPVSAPVFVTADNHFRLYVNGELVARSGEWSQPRRLDLTRHLRPGVNDLAAWTRNDGGPAGFFLSLALVQADGSARRIETGSDWTATSSRPFENWTDGFQGDVALRDLGPMGSQPWGSLAAVDPEPPAEATSPDDLTLPRGFRAELVYTVPSDLEGSWVSLTEDDRGRLLAGDQYGALYRITLGDPVRVEELSIELEQAQGLAWHRGALYAVTSGGHPGSGLYRVRDTNGDDHLDELRKLASFDGDGEHGPHAVVPAPDGSLWIIAGNHTNLPAPITRSRVPRLWAEDQVLPRLPDPNGHAVGKLAPGGWVVRTADEGRTFELVAIGMRNAYDLAFDAEGEPFTYDSDMEWDVGLPWYRPTRILHLASGADFGWRHGSGKWSELLPDTLPAAVDLALGSPTGVTFAPSGFPPPYAGTLLAGDWAYGRIHAVRLAPRGGGYGGDSSVFLEGKPLPVTDLVAARDGALYFLIGGRRVQSALYRVSWVGDRVLARIDRPAPPREQEERRRLASLHGARPSTEALEAAWTGLGSPDREVRHAARVALEHQPVDLWRERALGERGPRTALAAYLALTRAEPDLAVRVIPARLLALNPRSLSEPLLLECVRVLQLLEARSTLPETPELEVLAGVLLERYPVGRFELDRELLTALAPLAPTGLVARALAAHARASDAEALYVLHALARVERGWDAASERTALARLALLETTFTGGNSARGYLEAVADELRTRLGVGRVEAVPADAPAAATTSAPGEGDGGTWTPARLAPLLADLGVGRDFARGRDLFTTRTCLECHRLGGAGGNQGPDLTGVAGRMSARDLVAATLEPSREVPDAWQETELWDDDRLVAVGRLEDTTDEHYVLRSLPPANERLEIPHAEISEARRHALSRMPTGLADGLREHEVLDLLAYVLSGGDPRHSFYED